MTSAKSDGGKARAMSLPTLFSVVRSLNSRSVLQFSTANLPSCSHAGTEFFHITPAKSDGSKARATSLHVMFSMVRSLNSRSVVRFSAVVV